MGIHKITHLLYQQAKLPPSKLQSARRLKPDMHLGTPGVLPTRSPLLERGVCIGKGEVCFSSIVISDSLNSSIWRDLKLDKFSLEID
jgi:hypothetical protein